MSAEVFCIFLDMNMYIHLEYDGGLFINFAMKVNLE